MIFLDYKTTATMYTILRSYFYYATSLTENNEVSNQVMEVIYL